MVFEVDGLGQGTSLPFVRLTITLLGKVKSYISVVSKS